MFSGSMVALVTPFTSEDRIDFDCLTQLIEWHIEAGTSAIVVAGTTGESPTLSNEEKIALAEYTVKISQGRILVIVGNGSYCTRSSCLLTEQLNDTGIDGYLTVSPYYNKPTDEGLIAHFTEIANVATQPVILYNVPGRTLCDMSNEVIQKLSELSNVVGLKDATGDLSRVAKLRDMCKSSFKLFSGDDATGVEFCKLGGDGVISVTANLVPKQMAEIQRELENKNQELAVVLDNKLTELHNNLFVESNPIAIKWAMFSVNIIPNTLLRLPLTVLSSQGQQVVEQTIKKLNIFPQES